MSSATMDGFKGCLLLLICFIQLLGSSGASSADEARLIDGLISSRRRHVRPVEKSNDTVKIRVGLDLIRLVDLHEANQMMKTDIVLIERWTDKHLMWNPDDYGGITQVQLPPNKIWNPNLVIFNSGGEDVVDTPAVVQHTGEINLLIPTHLTSYCALDMEFFPRDVQWCQIKIGSWTYDNSMIEFDFYEDKEEMGLDSYMANGEWRIESTSAHRRIEFRTRDRKNWQEIRFSLHIRRMAGYYMFVCFGPAILLALLTPFIFLLPPTDSQRLMLGVGLLICFSLFFKTVASVLPPAHANTPIIDKFCLTQNIVIVLSIMLSTLVANIARKTVRRPPAIITKIVLGGIGRCLCFPRTSHTDLPSREKEASELVERGEANSDVTQSGEWLLVANVIDRLLFLLSILVTLVMIIVLVAIYP